MNKKIILSLLMPLALIGSEQNKQTNSGNILKSALENLQIFPKDTITDLLDLIFVLEKKDMDSVISKIDHKGTAIEKIIFDIQQNGDEAKSLNKLIELLQFREDSTDKETPWEDLKVEGTMDDEFIVDQVKVESVTKETGNSSMGNWTQYMQGNLSIIKFDNGRYVVEGDKIKSPTQKYSELEKIYNSQKDQQTISNSNSTSVISSSNNKYSIAVASNSASSSVNSSTSKNLPKKENSKTSYDEELAKSLMADDAQNDTNPIQNYGDNYMSEQDQIALAIAMSQYDNYSSSNSSSDDEDLAMAITLSKSSNDYECKHNK